MKSSMIATQNHASPPVKNTSENTSSQIQHIPIDLAEAILEHLDTKTLKACRNLSPDCKQLLQSERVWKKHAENIIPDEIMALLTGIPSYKQKVTVFHSPNCQKITTVLANKDLRSDISLNGTQRIFSKELIQQLKSPEGHFTEKVKLIGEKLDAPLQEIAGTPILAALSSSTDKELHLIEILLQAGANPNVQVDNNHLSTPLHRAAFFASEKKVKLLLRSGANPLLKNSQGETPLDLTGKGLNNNPLLKTAYETSKAAIKEMLLSTTQKAKPHKN